MCIKYLSLYLAKKCILLCMSYNVYKIKLENRQKCSVIENQCLYTFHKLEGAGLVTTHYFVFYNKNFKQDNSCSSYCRVSSELGMMTLGWFVCVCVKPIVSITCDYWCYLQALYNFLHRGLYFSGEGCPWTRMCYIFIWYLFLLDESRLKFQEGHLLALWLSSRISENHWSHL